jgi:hypothetical protein
MKLSKYRVVLTLVLMIGAIKSNAQCNEEDALNFLASIHSHQWLSSKSIDAEGTDGDKRINTYSTEYGLKRKDVSYCTSYYCISFVEMINSDPKEHKVVYFIQWGGTVDPSSREQSIVFSDEQLNKLCVIQHSGGQKFFKSIIPSVNKVRSHSIK